MLRFKLDWEDESRVRDQLLRETWARLEIVAGDPQPVCLTQCAGGKSHSLRQGVYGSIFPLAQWVVENWWSILFEPVRTEQFLGGRHFANDAKLRPWVQRHNLLAGRCGFALPDLTIYRDGGVNVIRSVPDPFGFENPYPVQFFTEAELRLHPDIVVAGLRDLVDSVADRVRDRVADHPEVADFLRDWEAVKESARSESLLCSMAAAMGLDPYASEDLSDDLVQLLETVVSPLSPSLRQDLVDVTTGISLREDVIWTQEAAAAASIDLQPNRDPVEYVASGRESAHLAGYELARRIRGEFGSPGANLEAYTQEHLGWGPITTGTAIPHGTSNIHAIFGSGPGGLKYLVSAAENEREAGRRFLVARAIYFSSASSEPQTPRLLTRSSSWSQRASRAFAAEFLVPADVLKAGLGGEVTYQRVDELAREFQVSPMVISHQLINHRIARVIDL